MILILLMQILMFEFDSQVEDIISDCRVSERFRSGKLVRVVGLTLEAKGILAPLGAHCQVENLDYGTLVDAEGVGFNDDILFLMPFADPGGLGPGARV